MSVRDFIQFMNSGFFCENCEKRVDSIYSFKGKQVCFNCWLEIQEKESRGNLCQNCNE